MQAWLETPESIADQRMIAEQVFETMVDMELTPVEEHLVGTEVNAIAALLHYSGPWQGAMLIECTLGLALTFTARLMSIERPAAVDADVLDSMGELVNMVGGNLKGLMPEETCISTPKVISPGELDDLLGVYKRVSRVCFNVGGEHCCISLVEQS
jgi:chemotaxis protein CheX